jgi:hypothetical protein
VREFVERTVALGGRVSIVSHKTPYAAAWPNGRNLQDAALAWLDMHGFIGEGFVAPADVFFESSRSAKLARLRARAPEIVIDDLVEVLTDPEFPASARRWLFSPGASRAAAGGIECFGSWQSMGDELAVISARS